MEEVLDAIRDVAKQYGRTCAEKVFTSNSGLQDYQDVLYTIAGGRLNFQVDMMKEELQVVIDAMEGDELGDQLSMISKVWEEEAKDSFRKHLVVICTSYIDQEIRTYEDQLCKIYDLAGVSDFDEVETVLGEAMLASSILDSAGVEFADDRLSYVTIQVDRNEWLSWEER